MPDIPYGREYTPELSQDYLNAIYGNIDLNEQQQEGLANKEAIEGGLFGAASYGSKVGMARMGAAQQKANALANFGMNVAGQKYSERLRLQQQQFQASEAQKNREEQERLTNLGFQFREGMLGAEQGYNRVMGQQGLVAGGLMGIGVNLLNPGNWMGGGSSYHQPQTYRPQYEDQLG